MLRKFKKSQILILILLVEAFILLLACIVCFAAGLNLSEIITKFDSFGEHVLLGIGIGFSLSALSITSSRLALNYEWFKTYSELIEKLMRPLFSKFSLPEIILVSIASGFCEEVFFRGVLQSVLGIYMASAIFGFCHFAGWKYFFYVIWAGLAGLLFGYVLIATGSLWPAIIAHVVNNFVSIIYLRYGYSREEEEDSFENH